MGVSSGLLLLVLLEDLDRECILISSIVNAPRIGLSSLLHEDPLPPFGVCSPTELLFTETGVPSGSTNQLDRLVSTPISSLLSFAFCLALRFESFIFGSGLRDIAMSSTAELLMFSLSLFFSDLSNVDLATLPCDSPSLWQCNFVAQQVLLCLLPCRMKRIQPAWTSSLEPFPEQLVRLILMLQNPPLQLQEEVVAAAALDC
ncbi:hypothetical protein Ahy_B06g081265 isoform C [Arachis hypogaea]|uniref:Secreted protein n=1 Tax=Arachis hypogaea TaxID=3818 RepID=A0A444YKQ2_ARAHY|nr:hypothetical protein Ahy_B06g081265 isoform C [Arachis hypogaea]